MRSRDGLQRRASFDGISLDDGEHGAATSILHRGAAVTMWGTSPRQRLRLRPLEGALRSADWLGARGLWRRGARATREWPPGVSVVIPERDAPAMLSEALASVTTALEFVGEPHQIIVVANGVAAGVYAEVRTAFPAVEFSHSLPALGFSAAIARGVARARHGATYLMNNDVTLDPAALSEVLARRDPALFSISSQIFQQGADGRREETGFIDWYADRAGIHVFHAPVRARDGVHPHLAGSGGATLFRTALLARYVRDSLGYDPFYWEDIEWGVRAWQDGYGALFCPASHAFHRHRVTTARFFAAAEIDRIVERNRVLFDLRNRATRFDRHWRMNRVCQLPYASQRELARGRVAAGVLVRRASACRAQNPPPPPVLAHPDRSVVELAPASYSYRLRAWSVSTSARARLLVVTPFAVFPPRHGGARRIAGMLTSLRRDFDTVLVTDEGSLYGARSFPWFDDLCAVHFVERAEDRQRASSGTLEARMADHCHAALHDAVREALARYRPSLVQIEHAEIAELIRHRSERERWVLGLHDAYGATDFASAAAGHRFENGVLSRYDAITVCSEEDRALVAHRCVVCVPNGSSIPLDGYRPSESNRLMFMGPFRYAPNIDGVRRFLREAYPAIRAAVPDVALRVLGGDDAARHVDGDAAFALPGVEVVGHRDDVPALLEASALTINPVADIRGSSIKVIESLTAGRACVSTAAGARGFHDAQLAGLVVAEDVASMVDPIVRLLRDVPLRHRVEAPETARLARYQWAHCAGLQRALYDALLGDALG